MVAVMGATQGEGEDAPRIELPTGARVDKYEIVRRLGEGGMATIYLATSVGPGGFTKPCALKLLRPELAERDPITRMLVTEARVAAVLSHPNIVQVFDFGRHGHSYFMAMEWVDGVSLGHLMARLMRERRRLPIPVAIHVALHVAEALAYLREGVEIEGQPASLVHRDVSPSNILISSAGAVKLTDFGIVKVLEAPTHTRVGVVKGKYAYMAPEQLRGEPVDHRADLFSLGVVLFELLTMARLFHRPNIAATIAAVHAARVPPPSSLWPDIPPELDVIVRRLLAKKREERYADASEVGEELLRFGHPSGRGELTAEVRALMAVDRANSSVRPATSPSLEVADDALPSVAAEEFADLELLEDEHDPTAVHIEEDEEDVPFASPVPLAEPDATSPLARVSLPPRPGPARTPTTSVAPRPAVASTPPRPAGASSPPRGRDAAASALAAAAMSGPLSVTMPPSTTSFSNEQPRSWVPAAIVGVALLASAAFWLWMLA
jgi:serine/threonine-protein kinase